MKNYRIENEYLSVEISEFGAELTSIYNKKTGQEMMWQPDDEVWSSQAPVLFPLVGRLKSKKYVLDGKEYEIEPHGFALNSMFSVSEEVTDSISFFITDTAETFASYPFHFKFTIKYSLDGAMLTKKHIIANFSENIMYYEVGGHEGYALENIEDYYLKFENPDYLMLHTTDEDIMLNHETSKLSLENGKLPLSMELFANDALILEGVEGSKVELCNQNGRVLTVSFPGIEYLGIWTRYRQCDTKYVCIEPWSALPDGNYLDYELANKVGISSLRPGERSTHTYYMSVG